ncbi:MAG: aminotransferase class V-fold PLP-dependent enzyme [Deltaproteobacteria bacterium]|uniref:cysteine desulfurase n=1 Tax=Candidatus Zymogenus saltonus TaxID=2844893 RepID=A0A9D8KA25_9DELT|nr:aminotransferase class V-fold PLP-dependent enzyme [Candidatus Zymogenus saltonus]
MIYLDNAATSWPKPKSVVDAVSDFMKNVGANPGRSGHRLSMEAERIRLETRELIAKLFGGSDPFRVIFTLNVTEAINLVIGGLVSKGGRVVTTSMEHNAVMRPLRHLEKTVGIEIALVPVRVDGTIDIEAMEEALGGGADLAVVNHASNVSGTIVNIAEVGRLTRKQGVPLLVDAAQSAGSLPIDIKEDMVDILAFTGHKGLLGPTGTGGVVFGDDFDCERLPPAVFGGTGSRSEMEYQPDFLPDKYESGTANVAGIAGLCEGVRWILDRGVDEIRAHEVKITGRMIEGLSKIDSVKVIGTGNAELQTATVSFVVDGIDVSEVAASLCDDYDVMCRVGLHCAPRAHMTLGTFPEGTVRFGMGPFTTIEDVDSALRAVGAVVDGK